MRLALVSFIWSDVDGFYHAAAEAFDAEGKSDDSQPMRPMRYTATLTHTCKVRAATTDSARLLRRLDPSRAMQPQVAAHQRLLCPERVLCATHDDPSNHKLCYTTAPTALIGLPLQQPLCLFFPGFPLLGNRQLLLVLALPRCCHIGCPLLRAPLQTGRGGGCTGASGGSTKVQRDATAASTACIPGNVSTSCTAAAVCGAAQQAWQHRQGRWGGTSPCCPSVPLAAP